MGESHEEAEDAKDAMIDQPAVAASNNSLANNCGEVASSGNEKPEEPMTALSDSDESGETVVAAVGEEYPTGLRLVLLAGASMIGVFLISLDQVSSNLAQITLISNSALNTNGRPSLVQPFPRSQTNSVASKTSLGTAQPTS